MPSTKRMRKTQPSRRTSRSRSRSSSRSRSRSVIGRRWRIRQPLALKPHTFCERVIEEDALIPNGAGLFKSFSLDSIYNSVSYQKLFEYYTINKVIVTFRYKQDGNPRRDVTQANQMGVNEANPMLIFKVDHNEITADTIDVMKASSKTREYQFTNDKPKFDITIKPAVLDEIYKSTVASTYCPVWGQKLSMADPSVPHYGLKVYARAPGAAAYGSIVVTYKMYFTCKNNE